MICKWSSCTNEDVIVQMCIRDLDHQFNKIACHWLPMMVTQSRMGNRPVTTSWKLIVRKNYERSWQMELATVKI